MRSLFAVGTLAVLFALPLAAQDSRGTILGRVTDPAGAAIPAAEVRAINVATGVSAAARSNESGNYTLPYLIPGVYTLTVELSGFNRFSRDGLQVRINDTVEVNIQMQIGDVSQAINVSAETPILSTTEASLGQVVDERRVMELPLFAGNALDLVHLAPGTVNGTDMRLRKAPFNSAPSQFSTAGSGNNNNEFAIDGVSNTFSDGTAARVAFSVPQSAYSEFRMQTSSFDAGLGHTMGSVVNISTRSGANLFHGEAHWWLRHSVLDAPSIFQNRAGQKLPIYQDNRYGLSGGAPVILPGLYNGRNRTFWFYCWEANKFGDPTVGQNTSTVPTDAMRNGDLSGLLALGANYQVYDPFTATAASGGRFARQPFAGNLIPRSRFDPVGVNLLKLWPRPNQPGLADGRNNYFMSGKALEDYWVQLGRIDHAFSENHRVFVRLHRDYWQEDKNRDFGDSTNGVILNRVNRGIAFDDVYVFNPSLVINVRYGLTQQDFPQRRVSRGFDLASLGFSPALVSLIPKEVATIPNTQVGSLTALSNWEALGDGVTSSLTHHLSGTFTWLKGNHNLRFGPEFRVYREFANRYPLATSPQLQFLPTYASGPYDTSAPPPVGGELAALLLGIPEGSMIRSASYAEQDLYYGLYLHDDFRVTPKLTLNLGLRYELETPMTERYNRSVAHFAFNQPSPMEEQARANYAGSPMPELPASQFRVPGGDTFVGVGGNPRAYWKGQKLNFLPRFGIAYQLRPQTIIRGGYGIFFGTIGVNRTNSIQDGFSLATPIQPTFDQGLTFVTRTANPLPGGLREPLGAAGGLLTNLGQGVTFFDEKRKQPYAQRWSLGVQRQLPAQFLIDASYVGNRATRLGVFRNLNFTPAQYLSRLPVRDQPTIDYLAQKFPNPGRGLHPIFAQTARRSDLLVNYPQFAGVSVDQPIGYSWYHSLQVRVERRFADGFTFQLSYTWSKFMEAIQFLNVSDPMPYESISTLDRPHRVVATGIWEIPAGRGRRFGASMHPVLNGLAGGWQLSGVMQRQNGPPLGFNNIIFTGNTGDIKFPKDLRGPDHWFNVNAGFNRNSSQQLASNIVTWPLRFSGLRGDGQARWDFTALKNFQMTEKVRLQFRAECFNAWNHPNLRGVNTNPAQSAFATITAQDPPRSWQTALRFTF